MTVCFKPTTDIVTLTVPVEATLHDEHREINHPFSVAKNLLPFTALVVLINVSTF